MNPSLTITANVQQGVNSVRQYTRTIEEMRRSLQGARGDMDKLSREEQELWDQLNEQVQQGLNSKMGSGWRRKLERLGLGDAHVAQIMSARLPASDAGEKFKRDLIQHFGGSALGGDGDASFGEVARGLGLRSLSKTGRQIAQIFRIPLPDLGGAGGAGAMALRGGLGIAGAIGLDVAGGAMHGAGTEASRLVDLDHFYRTLAGVSFGFDGLNAEIKRASTGLRLTYEETQSLARRYSISSAAGNSGLVISGTRQAAAFARAYGMDPGDTAQAFGTMHRMGGIDPTNRKVEFALADIAQGMGQLQLMPELRDALAGIMEQQKLATGAAPDTSALLSIFGSMNRSGNPAMQGAAGAQLLSGVGQTIAGGGARGEASEAWILAALQRDNPNANIWDLHSLMQAPFKKGPGGRTAIETLLNSMGVYQGMKGFDPDQFIHAGRANALSGLLGTDDNRAALFAQSFVNGRTEDGQALQALSLKYGFDLSTPAAVAALPDLEEIAAGHGAAVRSRLAGPKPELTPSDATRMNYGLGTGLSQWQQTVDMSDAQTIQELLKHAGEATAGSDIERSQAAFAKATSELGAHIEALNTTLRDFRTGTRGSNPWADNNPNSTITKPQPSGQR